MNKFRPIVIIMLLILGSVVGEAFRVQGAKPMAETSINQSATLLELLVELGKKYDHFFTIEEAWKDREPMNAMEAQRVQMSSGKKTLQQELEQLRQTLPNFSYEIDKANPRIIHILDERLTHQKGYGLESVVNRIDFTGSPHDLVAEIGNQGILISPQTSMLLNEFRDYSSVLQVKGESLKVRDALTNFISLKEREVKILWIARTKLAQGEMTRIYYLPPGKKH